MIAFLTLIYIGILFLLVRVKIVPWNTFWKISPAIWIVLLFVILFIPMNWGAPSGPVVLLRQSVAIVPSVAGEVIDVPVKANVPLKEGEILFRIDPTLYEAQFRQIGAQLDLARIELDRARHLEERQTGTLATLQQREAEVDQLAAQLDAAKWNLDRTTVRAPSDGFVTNVGLRRGARVAAFPTAAVMAFIETDETIVGVQVQQIYARHVAPGQTVELAFKYLPGQIHNGRVVSLLPATEIGQGRASGSAVQAVDIQPFPFAVRVELENPAVASQIPAGSTGEAAIYTDSVTATHIIRRVMIRMSSYLNYVLPF